MNAGEKRPGCDKKGRYNLKRSLCLVNGKGGGSDLKKGNSTGKFQGGVGVGGGGRGIDPQKFWGGRWDK